MSFLAARAEVGVDAQSPDAGDAEFAAFVRATSDSLHRTAYLLTGSRPGAQDAVQTALVKVYRAWDRRDQWDNRVAYARRAVVNVVLTERERAWTGERAVGEFPDRLVASTDGGGAAVDDRDALRRALRNLPARQRAAVVLRHYLDLSEAQAAAELDCAVGTVKSLTARGLAALRSQLGDHAPGGTEPTDRTGSL